VLGMIVEGPLSVSAIARRVGVTRQNVQRIANRVVQDGLARYLPNPDHSTSNLVALSPQGRRTLEEVTHRQIQWANRTAQDLEVESMVAFTDTLQRLCEQLQLDKEGR